MLIEGRCRDDTVFSAVALYAVRAVVHKMRAQSCRDSDIQKHLWEQVRIAALQCNALAQKLKKLWVNH